VAAFGDAKPRSYSELPAIRAGDVVLWRNPAAIERKDLRIGPGGRALAPQSPFTFLEEESAGASPKVLVRDRAGRKWSVKFGNEVSGDVFGSRLAWALGYHADPTYYVARGTIRRAVPNKNLKDYIDPAGRFRHARFELRSKSPEYLPDFSWSWDENPFVNTRELNGLKILTMLLSNWDNKDLRDSGRGSNAGIYRHGRTYIFFINDWGSTFGDGGRGPTDIMRHFTHSKWDCDDYSKQSRKFVKIDDGELDWGYQGGHIKSMTKGVTADDVRWLMHYLGRISPQQIRAGLLASGATAAEAACFTDALMVRIGQLAGIAKNQQPGGRSTNAQIKSRESRSAASTPPVRH
jgi:hypothetical protein